MEEAEWKKKTKAEEKEVKEAKERKEVETKTKLGYKGDSEPEKVYSGLDRSKEDDGIIRKAEDERIASNPTDQMQLHV